MPAGEMSEFDDGIIDELIDMLTNFNIRATEEKLDEVTAVNYGTELNTELFEIKKQVDVFDYHKAKELLLDLKRRRNESGI